MADIDLNKIPAAVSDALSGYLIDLTGVLTRPREKIEKLLRDSGNQERVILRGSLTYSTISILLGICLAEFLRIPGKTPDVTIVSVVSLLIIWVMYALVLHPLLRWFGGRGRVSDTVAVFLLIVSSLNLFFVPAAKALTMFVTKTQVVLTYDYVISMGPLWSQNKVEVYFKDKEPEKEGTILVPHNVATIESKRVRAKGSPYPLPKRQEVKAIDWDLGMWIIAFSLFYYLSHIYYLSEALSVPHSMSPNKLRVLGIVGVLVAAAVFLLIGTAVFFGLVYF